MLQDIFTRSVGTVLRLEQDVSGLVAEKERSLASETVVDVLLRGVQGLLSERAGEGSTLKASLEAILCQLCRLSDVLEIRAECSDRSENALLFKSVARKDKVQFNEYNSAESFTAEKSNHDVFADASEVSLNSTSPYTVSKIDYSLDYREIQGSLSVLFGASHSSTSSIVAKLNMFDVISRALARRVYELNKTRKLKVALKKRSGECTAYT
jgi:hypothetical protein